MSKRFGHFYVAFVILVLAFALGCSSSSKKTPPGVQFVNPASSPTIDEGQSVNLTVSVSDNSSVTWKLQAGFGKPKGTLSNKTGTSATYTAPANVPVSTQVTVVATSGTSSAALAVFIEPAPEVTGWVGGGQPTFCPPNGTILQASATGIDQVGRTRNPDQLQVTETGGIAPYTWSLVPDSGSLPDGMTLQLGTDTSLPSIVGAPIAPGCSSFKLQVTDAVGVSDTSETLYMVVIPPGLKVNAPTLHLSLIDPSNDTGIPYPPAMMLASGGTTPYAWSVNSNSLPTDPNQLPPGLSMTSNGLIKGAPSPDGLSVFPHPGLGVYFPLVQVSDHQFPYPATAQISPTMPVNLQTSPSCPTGSESSLKAQGSYAFQLRGFDANGPVTISGNFVVDGTGNITGGKEDISRSSGTQTALTILPGSGGTGSSYTLVNNRGCVTLVTSAGTTTFRIAMGGCNTGRDQDGKDCQADPGGGSFYFTSGHMLEFDDSTGTGTRVSGIVRLQDSTTFQNSGINGMYAFGLSGWDAAKARFAMAGSATASSGSWSSVAADTNDAGTLGTGLTGGSGTFSVGADGRGTGTMTVGTLSLNLVLYPVSSHEVLIATVGPPSATNPLLSGEAITTAGPFTSQSLQNSHMFHIAGSSTEGPDPSIGTLAFDGVGGFTGVEYENQAGTLSSIGLSGGYGMDGSTGRFSFTAAANQNLGHHPLVGYVIPAPSNLSFSACIIRAACITGFLLSTDPTAQAGVLEFQTPMIAPPPPFTAAMLQGDYVLGTDEALDSKSLQFTGSGTANPTGPTFSLTQDASYGDPTYCLVSNCVLLLAEDPGPSNAGMVLKYAVNSDGSGAFGGQTVSVTNGATTFYIDESPLNLHPAVIVVEQ